MSQFNTAFAYFGSTSIGNSPDNNISWGGGVEFREAVLFLKGHLW